MKLARPETTERQASLDTYYFARGPCCAGCDWWRAHNSRAGECHRTRMVAGVDRSAPLGIEGASLRIGAGHVMTPRDHVCGEFRDEFDWSSLPLPYRKRVGDPSALSQKNDASGGGA
ncbi:hypothetical protein MMMDOFMJ_1706 [Methylobacterium gnaphalii]|uniref:Uncharacterized protein n=1 Tax=Methylobacterium gnaphalii TaxID=1010610 RepID=A0A512JPB1_9HYPH|nr:hypothetical protein MGN01_35480 [Methylobacterium gnaphalii]GJD68782.1 hypothetical protein MMMDOFMJ_1706 [Methylobacterium gnaphalii]GLS50200.1 hypothetical protein GCM10007885_30520 [Methylobacterium gnaphalii]